MLDHLVLESLENVQRFAYIRKKDLFLGLLGMLIKLVFYNMYDLFLGIYANTYDVFRLSDHPKMHSDSR